MRKFVSSVLAVPAAILLVVVLSACQSAPDTSDPAPKAAPAAEKVVSYDGTWTAEGFLATIKGDSIEVNLVTPDTKGLYWLGTFPVAKDSDTVTSVADTEKLEMSLFGSSDTEKVFTIVNDDQIDFDFTIMGTTSTIHLER